MSDYLTTREVAGLLRVTERKVYSLASAGKIPCTKTTGKLLFPQSEVEAWLADGGLGRASASTVRRASRPLVFLGSHDPLLDWALRESGCGIATFMDGSSDGLKRFVAGEGIASGLHIHEPVTDTWNVEAVTPVCHGLPVVLVEWAKRQRGLIVRPELAGQVTKLADLADRTVVPRQKSAGATPLFHDMLKRAGIDRRMLNMTAPARTETDAAMMVLEGKADAAFGLMALAQQFNLPFVPLIEERFDLLIDRKAWFEPPLQTFTGFWRTGLVELRAREMGGYDLAHLGRVHFNGA